MRSIPQRSALRIRPHAEAHPEHCEEDRQHPHRHPWRRGALQHAQLRSRDTCGRGDRPQAEAGREPGRSQLFGQLAQRSVRSLGPEVAAPVPCRHPVDVARRHFAGPDAQLSRRFDGRPRTPWSGVCCTGRHKHPSSRFVGRPEGPASGLHGRACRHAVRIVEAAGSWPRAAWSGQSPPDACPTGRHGRAVGWPPAGRLSHRAAQPRRSPAWPCRRGYHGLPCPSPRTTSSTCTCTRSSASSTASGASTTWSAKRRRTASTPWPSPTTARSTARWPSTRRAPRRASSPSSASRPTWLAAA